MRRLILGFAGRTYHIVGNLMSRINSIDGSHVIISNLNLLLSLKIVLVLANNVDNNNMLCYAAFYLGLHCLPK